MMTDRYPIPEFLRRQPQVERKAVERPMLFSAPMVRALLAGTKTQTRRVMKQQPIEGGPIGGFAFVDGVWCALSRRDGSIHSKLDRKCPYGKPGDRLWVREAWAAFGPFKDGMHCHYRATDEHPEASKWKPPIHMPRVYSRILLEIVAVRVERLQDISEADAVAEGIVSENVIVGCNCYGGHHVEESADRYFFDGCAEEGFESAVDAYRALWESINGPDSWAANPWVFVISFRRVE